MTDSTTGLNLSLSFLSLSLHRQNSADRMAVASFISDTDRAAACHWTWRTNGGTIPAAQ